MEILHNCETLLERAKETSSNPTFRAEERGALDLSAWKREYFQNLWCSIQNAQNQPVHISRKVLGNFPYCEHRPIINKITIVSIPRLKWRNFHKADYYFDKFVGVEISTVKICIPRGYRKKNIPGWNIESEEFHNNYIENGDSNITKNIQIQADLFGIY